MSNLLIKGGSIVRTDSIQDGDILIENNVITYIDSVLQTKNYKLKTFREINATGLLIFPGLIDCHVHFREPGDEQKETMTTGAAAARAGGVTTVCEMPNTDPPTVTVTALADKVRRSAAVSDCDIRFFFGITKQEHLDELRRLWASIPISTAAGVHEPRLQEECCGVKIYLDHSTGNQKLDDGLLDDVFRTCAEFNIPLVAHCEDAAINARAAKGINMESGDISLHSMIRPPESEADAIRRSIELVRIYNTPFHVAHLSTAQGIELVAHAKIDGLPVTCEVTPHHLLLTEEHYKYFGTLVKMNPPLRDDHHLTALWAGIVDGTVDCIATDHAPHTHEEKTGAAAESPGSPLRGLRAPSGVPGVETMLPLLLTIAHGTQSLSSFKLHLQYTDIVRLCFENPNRIFHLRKHDIREGQSPDLVLVDPEKKWEIRGECLHGKSKWTPFEGARVVGAVQHVLRAQEQYRMPPEGGEIIV